MQCSNKALIILITTKFGSVEEQFNFLENSNSLVELSPVLVAEGE